MGYDVIPKRLAGRGYYSLSGVIFILLLVYATMRDTKKISVMHRPD